MGALPFASKTRLGAVPVIALGGGGGGGGNALWNMGTVTEEVDPGDMCLQEGKMPGTRPQSHNASGWGSFKMGTSSRWHYEWAPQLSQFLNPPPSPPTQWVDNQPPHPHVEDSPSQKVNKYAHPEVPTSVLIQP